MQERSLQSSVSSRQEDRLAVCGGRGRPLAATILLGFESSPGEGAGAYASFCRARPHRTAVVQGKYSPRVGLLAVFPLALLMFTGLCLFVLPYATKWGSGRRTD